MSVRTCGQQNCPSGMPATVRFLWPGDHWKDICTPCAARAVEIAEAMGFKLQIERFAEDGPTRTSRLDVGD